MKYTPTAEQGECQAKVDETFKRLPQLISDAMEFITMEEAGAAAYILKLWADFCELKNFAIPDQPTERPQRIGLPDNMLDEVAQDVIWALQERATRLEAATKPKLPEHLVTEMDAIHALAFDVANGCGFQMLSGGNK